MLLTGNRFIVRLFSLVSVSIVARLLTPQDYGVVAVAMLAVGFLQTAGDLKVNAAVIRHPNATDDILDAAFTVKLLGGIVLCLLTLAIAYPFAWIMGDGRVAPVLMAISIIPLLDGLKNPHFLLFERNIEFRREFWRAVASTLASAVVAIALAFYWRNYWALVAGTLAGRLVTSLATYIRIPVNIRFSLKEASTIIRFAGWLTLVDVIDYLSARTDQFVLGARLGVARLGIYNIGSNLGYTATHELAEPLRRALEPGLAIVSQDMDRLRRGYILAQAVTLAFVLPVGIGTAMLAREAIMLLFGYKWLGAYPVVAYLTPVMALQTLAFGVDGVALAAGATRDLFIRTCVTFAVRVPLILLGVAYAGVPGLIAAVAVSGLFGLAYGLALGGKLTETRWWTPLVASWRTILAGAAMAAVLWLVPELNVHTASIFRLLGYVAITGTLAVFVYLITHAALWLIAGRPDGAERSIGMFAARILNR
jgi:PST family polysaccharide transporter